jgi:hypothetical protein
LAFGRREAAGCLSSVRRTARVRETHGDQLLNERLRKGAVAAEVQVFGVA